LKIQLGFPCLWFYPMIRIMGYLIKWSQIKEFWLGKLGLQIDTDDLISQVLYSIKLMQVGNGEEKVVNSFQMVFFNDDSNLTMEYLKCHFNLNMTENFNCSFSRKIVSFPWTFLAPIKFSFVFWINSVSMKMRMLQNWITKVARKINGNILETSVFVSVIKQLLSASSKSSKSRLFNHYSNFDVF
jgi:hypothetical protein